MDSLQEAFFVCDETGAITEINSTFTDILGYGTEGLPYTPIHPWWPDASIDPDAHRQVEKAFAQLLGHQRGSYSIPVTHRDGHRVWVRATFAQAKDPATGRNIIVGTFRDITAEHYAIQRETALAALSTRLSKAGSLTEALTGALSELKALWRAEHVLAAVFPRHNEPIVTSTAGPTHWQQLSPEHRHLLTDQRRQSTLTAAARGSEAGVTLEHPDGPLALWIDLGDSRPFTGEDELLLSLLAGHLTQGLARAHHNDQQRETALALQRAILGPSELPAGFAVRYEPATPPLEVGGDWYDTVTLPDGRIGIVVGDCVGRGLKAAAVMGQLRSACRALLLQNPRPAQVLTALDHFAAADPRSPVHHSLLRHPRPGKRPPHLLQRRTPARHPRPPRRRDLPPRRRPLHPLAITPGAARPEGTCTMAARDTLLLYTDGLVERRRRPLTDGIHQAGRALQEGRDTPIDDLAGDVMTSLAPADGYDDDVALLLYRYPAPWTSASPPNPPSWPRSAKPYAGGSTGAPCPRTPSRTPWSPPGKHVPMPSNTATATPPATPSAYEQKPSPTHSTSPSQTPAAGKHHNPRPTPTGAAASPSCAP